MRAVVYDAYGGIDELALRDVPAPRPGRGQLRVAVKRAALNPKDAVIRRGKFRLLSGGKFPKQIGADYAGVVLESRSTRFVAGERVFGMLDEFRFARGTLAEEVVVDEQEAALLNDGVTDEAAAAVALAGSTALQALRDVASLQAGQRVLIHGASGGVGTLAVQIARLLGARVVTTSSAANLPLCRSLGAEVALDYRGEIAEQVDVVFDVFGNFGMARAARLLGDRGVFMTTVPSPQILVLDRLTRWSAVQKRMIQVRARRGDLSQLAGWLACGALRAVVDSRFPLESVRDAFGVLESKRARGKILIEIAAP